MHTELKDEPDSDFIILTYKDNEALDKSIVEQIEKNKEKAETSSYWRNWWNVYGLGLIGSLEGVVFNNWKIVDILPKDARLIGIGLDFGYSNDPTARVEIYSYNGQRIVNELVYRTGMLNSDIARELPKHVPVYADSAEPKSIEEIRRQGITIKGVKKGKDSITYGIDVMQRQEYLVTSNRPLKVAYLGPSATFTHLAASRNFGSSAEYIPESTIRGVFEAGTASGADRHVRMEHPDRRERLDARIGGDVRPAAGGLCPDAAGLGGPGPSR